jgi:hypothetical protein
MRYRSGSAFKTQELAMRHVPLENKDATFLRFFFQDMSNNTEANPQTSLIRWTDKEWLEIARRLCAMQGHATMDMLDLVKIRAKDIFGAQMVLPKERHRKLVSIAQKFERIRARLVSVIRQPTQTKDSTPRRDIRAGTDKAWSA